MPGESEMELKGDLGPKDLTVNWKDFLVDVRVDEECSDTELDILSNVLKLQGITIVPERENIYAVEDSPITIDANT